MSDAVIEFTHLLGALLSGQVSYLFMIGCGFFFGKVGLITKENLISFAKMDSEVFFPIYLFIAVCRSSFVDNLKDNCVIIISFLFYFVIAFLLSFLYSWISKMDLRYRFTFICLTSFIDVKRLHFIYVNSFCYLLKKRYDEEEVFCSNILVNSNVHVFYQGIVIWYLGYNLIKMDKAYQRQTLYFGEKLASSESPKYESNTQLLQVESKEDEEKGTTKKGNTEDGEKDEKNEKDENKGQKEEEEKTYGEEKKEENSGFKINKFFMDDEEELEKDAPLSSEEKTKLKEIYERYSLTTKESIENPKTLDNEINTNEDKDNSSKPVLQVFARQSFISEINKVHKVEFFKHKSCFKEFLYVLLRSPLIGLFVGFVVGFIKEIRDWIYNTKTPVYLFFDTFNNIGNCCILLGYLMIGANLSIKNDLELHHYATPIVRVTDYIVHFIFKIIIMPFLGVIFSLVIKNKFYGENRALNWTCYIQWMLPTSLDILSIIQIKDINIRFAGISLFVQYCSLMLFNNLVHVPCFLKVINMLYD